MTDTVEPTRALVPTPPMGWMSWNSFGRDLSEEVVLGTADALRRTGLQDAGYTYVCLDDHWHGGRGGDGRLNPDPIRFPRGIGALADGLHARGFKLGIYTCAGSLTCGGEPGSDGFEEADAATFADWEVDYVKEDYCHAPPERGAAVERYARMGAALTASGRSIVFAVCEWGERAPWEWGSSVGASMWRVGPDIQDAWSGPGGIVAVAERAEQLADWVGPGAWNDPDMLVVGLRGHSRDGAAGTTGCTDAEYASQVSLWAMLAAPLIISCDLRIADADTLRMLSAPDVIAIDQDPLGRPGRRVRRTEHLDLWRRELTGDAAALAVVNRADRPVVVTIDLPARHGAPSEVIDAWTGQPHERSGQVHLDAHGSALYRSASRQAGDVLLATIAEIW